MLNKNAVAYVATSFAATSMNTIFFFYYVKIFLDIYGVTQKWFQFAQVSQNRNNKAVVYTVFSHSKKFSSYKSSLLN